MMEEISALVDRYRAWLKDKTALRHVKDYIEITTPFLDRHNDYIQIYAKKINGGYLLTDDGYTIQDLELSGCLLDSTKRQNLLKLTLAGFGIKNLEGALAIKATADNFALKKHNLLQAILAVNDLFYLAQPYITSVFLEDVTNWLNQTEIRYTPKVKFTGKSGFDYLFDFVIPKSKKAPERLLKIINHPSKNTTQALAFSWIDTKEVREPDSKAYAILNDIDSNLSREIIIAYKEYDISPILWSQKEKAEETLAA